jgi:16S rRNA (uracil1498-N3)-methyltransferase
VTLPRFFAPSAKTGSSTVVLPADEAHHLRHVLRAGAGAEVAVFDGAGREWAGRVVASQKHGDVIIELMGELTPVAEPPVRLTLGIGVLKGDQMDAVVRDATMLGVSEIAPFASEHVSVTPRAWRSGASLERWQRVAIASAKQCGRAVVPIVSPVARFDELLGDAKVVRLMCVEPAAAGSQSRPLGAMARPSTALALIGPEGGWTAAEIEAAQRQGATLVHLGPRTLRAATAPTVLLSALWTVWGW